MATLTQPFSGSDENVPAEQKECTQTTNMIQSAIDEFLAQKAAKKQENESNSHDK